MTSGCVRSTLEPEQRMVDTQHYQEAAERLVVDRKAEGKQEKQIVCEEQQDQDALKKPRRKDTPVLNSPPHIPGARLLKAEKHMVHLEDEEQDGKD